MQMKIKYPAALVVLASTLGAFPAYADDALNLFNRMRDAVHSLSYAGSLVYVQGNEMSTYQIKHTIEEGAEKQRKKSTVFPSLSCSRYNLVKSKFIPLI